MKQIPTIIFKKTISLMIVLMCAFSFFTKAQVTINGAGSYATISAAVAAAIPGDIVEVSPGVYNETVTINKSIHLRGQPGQVLTTIIKAPSTLPLPATQNSNIVTVTGAGISAEINDLTIAGPGPSGCGNISYGIFVRNGAYANIHDNKISDVRDNPFGSCQNGVAIQIGRMAWSTTGTATIANNIITGYQKNGITVDNAGSSATILGNTITGAGTTAIIAQNGIQISRGATGSLTGNTVSGNSYHLVGNQFDWGSTGILLFQSGNVSLNGGNNLTGNDQNYYAYDPTGVLTLGAELFGVSSAPAGFGNQIVDYTSQNIDARSCSFGGITPAAMTMTQLFALEDYIYHSIDNPEIGFVYVKSNNDYITLNSFDAASGYPDAQIQRGIDAASNGFTVNVQSGTYAKQIATNRSVFGVNGPHKFGLFVDKDNLTIEGLDALNNTVTSAGNATAMITTNATNNFGSSGIFVQANGVIIKGLKIGDNFNDANVRANNKNIEVVGNGFTLDKTWISTATNEGAVYISRWDAAHPISSYSLTNNKFENLLVSINNGVGLTGLRAGRVITGNEFTGVRTPYLIGFRGWNGAGPVQGWIVDPVGGAVVTGNSFNTTGVDKYVVARGNAGGYINSEMDWSEIWNMNTYGNHVVTLMDYPSFDVRPYVDGAGYPVTRRISPGIQENESIGQAGDVVLVSAGTFDEDVNISKQVTLLGAGYPSTTVKGPIGGSNATFQVAASGVIIDGFTITRAGNTVAQWNFALNTAGIAFQSSLNNAEVRNCKIFGNRTGIDINNSNGNYIHNNIIDNNRTGMILRNQTNTTNVQQNFITNNWTLGILFLDGSGGTNIPPQQALNSTFNNNNISGNWYGDLQDRQSGGSIPAPGTNLKNFECNWYGAATAPIVVTANSSEPGYTAQIPVIFGGTAVPPGGQPNILGSASANIDFINWLVNGTDNSNPIIGFQPVPGSCNGSNILTITCPANISVQCASAVPAVNVGSVTKNSGTCTGFVVTHMDDVISNQTCANRYTIIRTYRATDACGNTATCAQTITVNDNTLPTITCPLNKTVSPTTLAGTVVTYTTPVVSDNCSGVGAPVRTAGLASGSTFPIGTTIVTYRVTDACGNTATCSFTVNVIDPYCDSKKKKAYVCHSGTTLCVSISDVQSHLNHGDYLGQCSTSLRSIVIKEPVADEFRVNVSPNPSAADFRIRVISKSMDPISVKVMDLSGKVLTVTYGIIKGSIVLGNELKPGTYIAEVTQGASRQVIKLVKVN